MYNSISKFYDQLQTEVNYQKYSLYIEKIIRRYNKNAKMVIDLGCGTGNLTILLKNMGYDVSGLDVSSEMLEKCYKKDKSILWIHQDIAELELYGTYDVFISFLDTINHITDKRKLKKAFKLIYNYMNNGGLFIFDLNTPYKFENVYKDNVFYMIDEHLTYIWENSFNRKSRICDMDITFFEKSGKSYKRYDDYHCERAYEFHEIEEICQDIGFNIIGKFKELTFTDASEKDERIFFVLKKEN
ncbi:MAG: class I SAM-dependent methyltransferase [Clostridia bacterium]|nr:class I SAM-dependent methyltransferase [Clostridia bacterium]